MLLLSALPIVSFETPILNFLACMMSLSRTHIDLKTRTGILNLNSFNNDGLTATNGEVIGLPGLLTELATSQRLYAACRLLDVNGLSRKYSSSVLIGSSVNNPQLKAS